MSLKTRREVVLAKAREYRMASKKDKGKILKELCDLTGYHPKYALVVLKKALDRLLSHEGGLPEEEKEHHYQPCPPQMRSRVSKQTTGLSSSMPTSSCGQRGLA